MGGRKASRKGRKSMKEKTIYILWMIPFLVCLAVLTAVPAFLNFLLSLTPWSLTTPGSLRFVGLYNYHRMISDPRFLNSMIISFYYIILPVGIQMILGFLLALALRLRLRGTGVARTLLLIPMVIPPVIIGLTWKVLFTPNLGGVNYYLSLLGIQGPDWLSRPLTAQITVLTAAVWEWAPFVMLLLLAAMESIPRELFEAAKIDGASSFQVTGFIIIPLLRPILIIVVLFRLMDALGILPIIYIMTKGGPASATETINFYAYNSGFVYYKVGYAASLIVVLFATTFALSWYFLNSIARQREEVLR